MKAEHTPTPYEAKPHGGSSNAWVVMSASHVLALLNRTDHPKWNRSHARFFARACNSHDKLLEACKRFVCYMDESDAGRIDPDLSHDYFESVLDDIKIAIAEAEKDHE